MSPHTPPCPYGGSPRPPELLAPAGRMEAFLAALDAGADAVYVGAHQFNARLRAQNFTRDDLARMAALAHDLGRKLYITLNTLVRDDELGDVAALLDDLRRIGPDALILQDLGVLRLARTLCPEIPLHASTQMTIHNADGALAAQKMGFERVVLARELTVDEIRAVRNACPVALEVFIHGALCYSVSGQCLFSSHVHGKSANRGLCLQPCRRAFFDGAGHKGNAYSTRDLDATAVLGRLVEAGVTSLKIEGRLKPAEAVAQIVRAYRLLLDAWPRIGREEAAEARRLLDSAVGRESCTGYLSAPRPAGLLGVAESQSGRRIGTTVSCRTPGHIAFRPTEPVSAGDRLRVQARPGQPPVSVTVRELLLDGRPVKRVQAGRGVEVAVPCPVPAGVAVVKAADAGARPKGFQNRLEKLEARMGRAEKARFPVQVRTGQGGVTLKAEAGAGGLVELRHPWTRRGEIPHGEALEILAADAASAPVRLAPEGSDPPTPFLMKPEELSAFRDRFLARIEAALNDARDAAVAAALSPDRAAPESPPVCWVILPALDWVGTFQKTLAARPAARPVHWMVPLAAVDDPSFAAALRSVAAPDRVGVVLPHLVFDPKALAEAHARLRKAAQLGIQIVAVANPAGFQMLSRLGKRRLETLVLPSIGCLNRACLAQLSALGANAAACSLEADAETLEALLSAKGGARAAVVRHAHVPLFQSRAPGPVVPSGTLRLEEPPVDVRVERRGDLTVTLSPRVFSHAVTDPSADWVYDFTWAQESPETLAAILTEDRTRLESEHGTPNSTG